jgi:hypothetical protein
MSRSFTRGALAVIALVVMLVQGTWVLAGTTGRVTGTVLETGTGKPVAGAGVSIASPSQTASTTTDAGGRFSFLSLGPDTYTITITGTGFSTATQSGVTVQADQTVDIPVQMQRSLQRIGGTTARSSSDTVRPGTVQDVYSVNGATQQTVLSMGGGGNLNNAYSAIASVPGVVAPYGGAGWGQVLFIHGSSYSQIGYEFDGIPVNRAFDNYNSNTLSNLGQQELQVITSGSSAYSASASVAGTINQTIRTGTYPGYKNATISMGAPTFYHQGQLEFGGAAPNRNFSYYVGLSGYNQDYRYGDQWNGGVGGPSGAFLTTSQLATTKPYNPGVYPACDPGQLTYSGPVPLGGDPGCSLFNTISYNLGAISSVYDREGIANVHIGIPHRRDASKDDIQVLYSGSALFTKNYTSLSDYGPFAGLAEQAFGTPVWADGFTSTNKFGDPATSLNKTIYLFPNSPTGRPFRGPLPTTLRDGVTNDSEIAKIQYQKNWEHSYVRVYGYTAYSDWLNNAPVFGALATSWALVAPDARDYELISHTRGASLQWADQINSTNQLIGTINYVTSSVVRVNNSGIGQTNNFAVSNYTNGTTCYSRTTGAPVSCFSGSSTGTFGTPNPAVTVPVAGASFIITDPGPAGTYNNVTPQFLTASLTDEWRPNDKLVLNAGVRLERFGYVRSSTDNAPFNFWFNQAANTYCYDLRTGQPLFANTKPQFAGQSPTLAQGFGNTCGIAGAGPTGRVDPATGDPVGNPNGQNGTMKYSAVGGGNLVRSVFEPRVGATYSINPDTVLRTSFGVYSNPFNTATVQYANLSPKTAATFDYTNFFGFGFTTPTHDYDPSRSFNIDFSLEHRIRGTDMSYKLSPFYRYVKNQYQDFLIGPNFVSAIPTGDETAYGLEVQFRKGDPSRNGWSGQLSYTYTNGFMKFRQFSNGSTVVTGLNQAIDTYNALTANGNRNGARGAPCYVGGVGTDQNGFIGGTQVCTPGGGAGNSPSLTAGAGATVVVNPYYNQPAQPYLNEGAPYPVYQTFPSLNGGLGGPDANQTILEPHAFSGFLNYRKNRLAVAVTGTATIGNPSSLGFARYGSPLDVVGVDPRSCGSNQRAAGITSAPNSGYPNWIDCGPSVASFGALYVPNPFTGRFDRPGEFQAPWLVNIGAQVSYDLSSRVRANLILSNVYNRCFGGSKTPWSDAFAPGSGVCTYLPNSTYVGNFYNGASPNDVAANGYLPPRQNLYPYGAVGSFLPFQAALQFQIKF